ncbi:LysR family transcriptional regulator [Vibrio hannami]|uniref:LysR family transcriptional regulator n=1 Tax=Vibrio hannami TaxID=2717094 RepID=UPI00240EC34E|nr:LysR family transcriptional regulator [Vibrio hannami]MDG3086348.1 LysR family transcriptional regulator [Vibrio hannami]
MLSLVNIDSFCTAYEQGSFSGAAKELGKDRTTIREHVTILEDMYDVKLFDIVGKRLQPTSAADLMYDRARHTRLGARQLEASLMEFHSSDISELTVYHDTLIPLALIIQLNRKIHESYPYIQVNWLHRNTDEALQQLAIGGNCLALTQRHGSFLKKEPIRFISLGGEKMSAYVRKGSPLADVDNLKIVDLQTHKQYVTENQFNWRPEYFCISPEKHIISNTDVLVEMLKVDGWGVLVNEVARPYVEAGELVELTLNEVIQEPVCEISMYYPPHLEHNPVFTTIRDEASAYAKARFV